MKRFMILAVLPLLLIGTMTVAHAQEDIPEVSTLSELQDAIAQAEEGDTIRIIQTITIDSPVTIGIDGKPVTLCGVDDLETFLSFEGDWGYASCSWLYDLTIDGTGSADGSKVVVDTPNGVYTTHVNCWNCSTSGYGAAIRIDQGTVYAITSSFSNCSADLGGAIYAGVNASIYPGECTFSNCSSQRDGGAIYSMGSICIVDTCTFINNSAVNGNGGAVAGLNLSVKSSTITGNRALCGGGLYLMGGTIQNSKIYANIGDVAGSDLCGEGSVSIVADDYLSLFEEILSENEKDSVAWYSDYEEKRHSAEAPTEIIEDTQMLDDPALAFVMYQKEVPEPEPEPEPEPTPTPTPTPNPKPSHSSSRRPQKVEPEPEPVEEVPVEPEYPSLACGKAELEGENVVYLIDALKRFTPAQERLTRGRAAALLYGLMTADSQAECEKIAVDYYDDLYGSPYQKAVSVLTGAGVFHGQADGLFLPDSIMSYGQLLTVLTRFVEPKEGYVGSFNVLDHWAAPAAVTAASYGWIEDVPIDLNAPATYGAFVNLLIKIYDL